MRRPPLLNLAAVAGVIVAVVLIGVRNVHGNASSPRLLNVSYVPTVELYVRLDTQFIDRDRRKRGVRVAPGVEIVTPDPRTSDNGKLSVLGA